MSQWNWKKRMLAGLLLGCPLEVDKHQRLYVRSCFPKADLKQSHMAFNTTGAKGKENTI